MAGRHHTQEEIDALRARRVAGEKLKDIAAELGVTRQRVHQLVGNCGRLPVGVQIGDIYNRLTVIAEAERKDQERQVLCRCECGTVRVLKCRSLRSKNTKSCGCLHREAVGVKRAYATINGRTQHRAAWSRELGVPQGTITLRMKKGMTLAEALTCPFYERKGRT